MMVPLVSHIIILLLSTSHPSHKVPPFRSQTINLTTTPPTEFLFYQHIRTAMMVPTLVTEYYFHPSSTPNPTTTSSTSLEGFSDFMLFRHSERPDTHRADNRPRNKCINRILDFQHNGPAITAATTAILFQISSCGDKIIKQGHVRSLIHKEVAQK